MTTYTPTNTYQTGLRLVDGNDMNQIANVLSGKITGASLNSPIIYPTPISYFPAAITTVGAGTLTAAALSGGLITRSGPTSSFTDTTDTAANIMALASAILPVGYAVGVLYNNTTAFPATLAGGSGVTISGSTSIPANSTALIALQPTSATAITISIFLSAYNNYAGYDPSTVATQFGSGTGTFLEEGNVFRYASGTGTSPGSTGNDNVLASYSLPANSFDGIGNRGLMITAAGSVANNTNAKRIKLYFNCTTATVGSAVTGGTVIADTGSYTTTGAAGWELSANVFKYGAAASNTQIALHSQAQIGATIGSLIVPTSLTATESGTILIAVTGNATTTATDIVLNWAEINAMN